MWDRWTAEAGAGAEAEAEAAVRCGRCSRRLLLFLSSRFPSIDKSDSRDSTRREKDYKGVSKENVRRWAFDTKLRDDRCGSEGQTGEVRF